MESVTKTENQQANACLGRQAPQGLGKSFFLCHHLAATIHPREDRLRCFPQEAVRPTARIAGGRLHQLAGEQGSCESGGPVRCQGATAPQTGGQQPWKVRIEPPNFE